MDCIVEHQVTGPGETNAYLLYDARSGEAALIDVGGSIDALTSIIDAKGLSLKYIFTTHVHVNHVWGLPAIRRRYPEAKWCVAREDFEDSLTHEMYHEKPRLNEVGDLLEDAEMNEELATTFGISLEQLGEPEVFVEDGQEYFLGNVPMRTILCPGHSRGGICLYVGDALFSGDVLLYRTTGTVDLSEPGAPETMRASILRLYELPDATRVYAGHGPATDLGLEKLHNWVVREV